MKAIYSPSFKVIVLFDEDNLNYQVAEHTCYNEKEAREITEKWGLEEYNDDSGRNHSVFTLG